MSQTTKELSDWQIAVINTMGEAILVSVLREAVFYVRHSSKTYSHYDSSMRLLEAKDCYLYVQTTGLDLILSNYDLNYDPEILRDAFNYCLRRSA